MSEPFEPLDPAPADTAPRSRRGRKAPRTAAGGRGDTKPKAAAAPSKGGRPSNMAKLEERLAANLAGIGALAMLWNQADGVAIVNHAPICAQSLRELAEQNPGVRKALEGALTGSAWTGVVFAFGSLAAALAANHGLLPAGVGAALATMGGPADGAPLDPDTSAAFEQLMRMADAIPDGSDDDQSAP